jgi:hypothetical protein
MNWKTKRNFLAKGDRIKYEGSKGPELGTFAGWHMGRIIVEWDDGSKSCLLQSDNWLVVHANYRLCKGCGAALKPNPQMMSLCDNVMCPTFGPGPGEYRHMSSL